MLRDLFKFCCDPTGNLPIKLHNTAESELLKSLGKKTIITPDSTDPNPPHKKMRRSDCNNIITIFNNDTMI